MRDPHCGIGLVDVLAAGAGGAEGVDAQVAVAVSTTMVSSTRGDETEAKEVCRRPLESKGEMRTSRWTPASAFRYPKAYSPFTSKVASLSPASSPA
jgi:shikimate kinase